MLTSLKIQNFKRHENMDLDLVPGLTIIQGPNYTGKSSILHAVLFALWGPSAVPGGKEVVIREGAKKAAVELGFTLGEDVFHVKRSGASATVTKNGETVAKSASVVTAYLEDLLGMSRERFLQLRYGEQKETEALLTLGIPKLHSIIEEISGADIVTQVITRASTVISECAGGLSALPEASLEEAEAEEARLAEELVTMDNSIKSKAKEISGLKGELLIAQDDLTQARQSNARGQAQRAELIRLRAERERLETEKSEADEQLRGTGTLQGDLQTAQDHKAEALEDVKQQEGARREKTLAARAVDVLTQRAGMTQSLVDKGKSGMQDAPDYRDPAPFQSAVSEAVAVFRGLKDELRQVTEAINNGVCPTCMRPFEGYNAEDMEVKRQQLDLSIVAAGESRVAAEDTLKQVETDNQLMQDMRSRLESDTAVLTQQRADLQQAIETRNQLVGAFEEGQDSASLLSQWEAEVDRLTGLLVEVKTAQRSLARSVAALERVESAVNDIGELPAQIDTDSLERRLSTIQDKLDPLTAQLTFEEGGYRGKYEVWEAAKNAVEVARKVERKRAELTTRKSGVSQLVKYLRKNRDRFLSRIWAGILSYASDFSTRCTGGTIESVVRNENGSFSYQEGGSMRPLKAASGAQRSIMGLGVQLAMAQMLPCPLSCLLLDEPTADLDPERSLSMAALLSAESNQLLMVSHRELDGAVAANVVNTEGLE